MNEALLDLLNTEKLNAKICIRLVEYYSANFQFRDKHGVSTLFLCSLSLSHLSSNQKNVVGFPSIFFSSVADILPGEEDE